jgi:hypothetical protein
MGQIEGSILSLILLGSLLTLVLKRWMLDALLDEIRNFRGGPPTTMHPSPADDGFLLRRRNRKIAD